MKIPIIVIVAFLSISILSCGPQLQRPTVSPDLVQQERALQVEMAFKMNVKRNKQLHRVYSPLRIRGAEFCGDSLKYILGFLPIEAKSFQPEYREIAKRVLDLHDGLKIFSVGPGSPAWGAGIRENDVIIDSAPGKVAFQSSPAWSTFSYQDLKKVIERARGGVISLLIQRDEKIFTAHTTPVPACSYSIKLIHKPNVNAMSNGKTIYVTTAMVRFLESDDELAMILGHELAHTALGHIDSVKGNILLGMILGAALDIGAAAGGVSTGGAGMDAGGRMGRMAYSQEFEMEADYLGLYFAAKADFDISKAGDLYRRMGIEHPDTIPQNLLATHPSTPERFVGIQETLKEIELKRKGGQPLIPEKPESSVVEVETEKD